MPQGILPLFAEDTTPINRLISFKRKEGMVYYFHGCLPILSHPEHDKASFQMFTSQLYVDGNCKQSEIVKAFGVTSIRGTRRPRSLELIHEKSTVLGSPPQYC